MKKTYQLSEAAFQLDGKMPLKQAIPLGLQHVLAMFVGNLTPLLIITGACGLGVGSEFADLQVSLLQNAMLVAGLVTLLQLFAIGPVGGKVPIIMGTSSGFIGVFNSVVANMGGGVIAYGAIMGASIIGGLMEGVLGFFLKPLRRFFPPVVTGTVVLSIGLSLISVGIGSFGGGSGSETFGSATNWILGTFTLLCCILFNIFAKSYFKQLSVLFGLIMGYIAAVILGAVDFSSLEGTSIIAFPQLLPFKPEFNINAIISVTLIFLVSATETIGDTSALAAAGLNREATLKETSGSIACDGFISALSSVFGCLPITSFSQNVGLVAMTKVVNRYAIGAGAVIMILAGIFPFFGSLLATLPDAVLGGCTLMMFGNIVISGLQMIGKCGFSQRNITIAALSLSIGIGFTQVPEIFDIFPQIVKTVFAENCVAVVFLVAILLNLVLPKNMEAAPAASDDSADA